MTNAELDALLADPESDRIERKESLSTDNVRTRVRQAICAYANDLPDHRAAGLVVIGLRDDGSCAGTAITDKLLLDLANMKDDGLIQPLPSIVVQRRRVRECEVAVVIVEPSAAPPVRFDGRTFIRVGPRRGIATREEEDRLAEKRRWRNLPFDLSPVTSATLDDLDLVAFSSTYLATAVAPEILEANHRSTQEQLRATRMCGPDGVPTLAGLLAVGKDPRSHIPGAYVQFVRFDGLELTDPIRTQREVGGPLGELLPRVEDLFEANNEVATTVAGVSTEARRPAYPLDALRQLLRNAIMHRSYQNTHAPVRISWFADRVEIQNPGGPFGQVTVDNFGTPGLADYRNPHVAEALKVLGFVQRFGVGISIARETLARNGNPPPEFLATPTHVHVTVRRAP